MALGLILSLIAIAGAAGGSAGSVSTEQGPEARPSASATSRPTRFPKPQIRFDPIPYGNERKRQMAGYSERHYGEREWRLEDPDAIVLHYTAGGTYESTHATFAANTPNLGEYPGVCAHFVVDQDGTIYQLVRTGVRCRHAIGINHRSIGIEMVQDATADPHDAALAILERRAQAGAAVRLVAWLSDRFQIRIRDVIGHAMVNDSRYFKDLSGWTNDHVDWLRPEVQVFRERVKRAAAPLTTSRRDAP